MPYQLFPSHSTLFFSALLPPGTVGWEWELIFIILVSFKPSPLIFKEGQSDFTDLYSQMLGIYLS